MNHSFDGNFGEVFERQPLFETKRCPKDVLKGLKKNHHSFNDLDHSRIFLWSSFSPSNTWEISGRAISIGDGLAERNAMKARRS